MRALDQSKGTEPPALEERANRAHRQRCHPSKQPVGSNGWIEEVFLQDQHQ